MSHTPNAFAIIDKRIAVAEDALAEYDFGAGVAIVQSARFSTDDVRDLTTIVYASYDDDVPDADSHRISFHVRFREDGRLDDVYALTLEKGVEIGEPGPRFARLLEEINASA